MKKISVLFVGFFLLSFCNLRSQNNYEVDFYIHDNEDSVLYLQGYCGNRSYIMDSLFVKKDGSFHASLKDYHAGMYMIKKKQGDMFSFLLDKSKVFSIEIYPSGDYNVEGSPENQQYFMYQQRNQICQRAMYYYKLNAQAEPEKADSLRKDVLIVIDSFNAFQDRFFEQYPDNLITTVSLGLKQSTPASFFENGKIKPNMQKEYMTYYRQHYWDNFFFKDNRILYTPYFIKQFNTYITELTYQDPDTVCLAMDEFIKKADKEGGQEYADYVLAWYMDNSMRMPFSFNELIFTYMVNKYIDRVSEYLPPSVVEQYIVHKNDIAAFLPGKIFPNITLMDLDAQPHSLYSIKENYTVVYFFSSTCESCKKGIDDLISFYKYIKDDYGVEIYSIDIEPDIAICKARQQKEPFQWIVTHATEQELAPYNFNLDHTPTIYILDKNKRVINKTAIYSQVEKTIKNDYFNKKENQSY